MDVSYTYGGSDWSRISLYAPPGLEPPEEIEMTDPDTGARKSYVRLSDRSLNCERVSIGMEGRKKIYRGCGEFECHRGPRLGECRCGSHSPDEARPQRI